MMTEENLLKLKESLEYQHGWALDAAYGPVAHDLERDYKEALKLINTLIEDLHDKKG